MSIEEMNPAFSKGFDYMPATDEAGIGTRLADFTYVKLFCKYILLHCCICKRLNGTTGNKEIKSVAGAYI